MADCNIVSGQARGCRNSSGGVIGFIIGTHPQNTTWFTATTDTQVITGMTGVSGFTYIPNKNSANWSEKISSSVENGSVGYEQTAAMSFTRSDSNLRNKVLLLSQNSTFVIAKERSGRNFLLGATDGCELSDGTGGSGTALTDLNGYGLTFTGMETAPAYEVSAAALAALIAASGTGV